MKLAAVGSNCIDYYNNLDGGKAFPGGGPVNMAVYTEVRQHILARLVMIHTVRL